MHLLPRKRVCRGRPQCSEFISTQRRRGFSEAESQDLFCLRGMYLSETRSRIGWWLPGRREIIWRLLRTRLRGHRPSPLSVIPAQAGICRSFKQTPAFAGVTRKIMSGPLSNSLKTQRRPGQTNLYLSVAIRSHHLVERFQAQLGLVGRRALFAIRLETPVIVLLPFFIAGAGARRFQVGVEVVSAL